MKKAILILLMLSLLVTLAGCSGDSKESKEKDKVPEQVEPVEKNSKKFYFDGEVAEIEDVKIKITETKVIPVGKKGNEYGEKPVFAIWYETTNKSDKDIDPMIAWLVIFEAVQDNNPNAINTLNVGMLPDDAHSDSQLQTIKKDGTVENSVAYELDDDVTPVTLVASKGMPGEEIGRKDFKID